MTSTATSPRRRAVARRCAALTAGALALALPGAAGAASTQEFPVAGGGSPQGITTGPDGNLWTTINLNHAVARVTPQGQITPFNVGLVANASPEQIVTGPDGNLWFTDDFLLGDPARASAGVIHRVTPAGQVTDFPLPTAAGSQGLTVGPDGALWYTMRNPSLVGRITTAGVVTEFPIPGAPRSPGKITAGADGALYFTEPATSSIGRLTTAGAYSQIALPQGADPRGITAGPDGAVWFTQFGRDRLGRIAPDGTLSELPLPGRESQPTDIITGPDGALWFAESFHGHVDRVSALGFFSSYTLPGGGITDLTTGPDGDIWYTRSTNLVGHLRLPPAPVLGSSVGAERVSGVVRVRRPGQSGFTTLDADGAAIPIGSEVDTTSGRVRLTAASGTGTTVTKTAEFYDGRFRLSQSRTADAVLDLKLTGPLVGCPARGARIAKAKPKGRSLWGSGKGTFRTSGKRSAATVRGTIWQVQDRCDGSTRTVVREGVVSVKDVARAKPILVKAGGSYTARAKRR